MHEVSVVLELLKIIKENIKTYKLRKINKITVKVGEFTCIEENALKFAFKNLSKDTICQNSQLIIQKIKASAYCDNCKQNFSISYTDKLCPKCNRFSNNIVTGYELILESIEGE